MVIRPPWPRRPLRVRQGAGSLARLGLAGGPGAGHVSAEGAEGDVAHALPVLPAFLGDAELLHVDEEFRSVDPEAVVLVARDQVPEIADARLLAFDGSLEPSPDED